MRVLIILLMSLVSSLAMADKIIVDAPADVKYLCGPDKNSNVRELLFPEIRLQVRNKETTN